MFGALLLFEDEFIHVVAISYTALILTELTMVTSTLIILIMTWPTLSSSGGSDHPYLAPTHGPGRAPLHSPLPSLTDSAQRILWYNVVLCKKLAISYFYRFTKIFLADAEFIKSVDFVWKTAVITGVSCLPLYFIKFLRRRFSPPSYQKLQWGGCFQMLLETTSPIHIRGCSKRLPQYASTLLFQIKHLTHFFLVLSWIKLKPKRLLLSSGALELPCAHWTSISWPWVNLVLHQSKDQGIPALHLNWSWYLCSKYGW